MRVVDQGFTISKNSQESTPVHLYIVHDYDGAGTNLYWAENDSDITFASQVYTKIPVTFDAISENNAGSIDSVQVTVSNVSRYIQALLEDNNFRGKKITIRTVWKDRLSTTEARIDDIYYIDSYIVDQHNATFYLTSKLDILDIEVPVRRFSRGYCNWTFKSTECGYTGPETLCNKTKANCVARNNFARFGGFPSLASSQIIIT